jgi:hypothetical protein
LSILDNAAVFSFPRSTAKLGKTEGNFQAYPRRNAVEDLPRQCGAQCLSPRYWHWADTWLHVVIGVVSLFFGFGAGNQTAQFLRHNASAREVESLRCADDLFPWSN